MSLTGEQIRMTQKLFAAAEADERERGDPDEAGSTVPRSFSTSATSTLQADCSYRVVLSEMTMWRYVALARTNSAA